MTCTPKEQFVKGIINNTVLSLLLFIFVCGPAGCMESSKLGSEPKPEEPQISSWPYEEETPQQRDARMAWWRQARFGMFIHWGVYAVPAGTYNGKQIEGIGEWIMHRGKIPVAEYKQYAKQFNPVEYDPDQWVRLAKEAGMKYIVITSKHHDGFALFDSKVTDWDVVDATPYGKDLLKPLAEACRKHGIRLGFYYSQAQDWYHPGGSSAGNKCWDDAQEGDMDEYIQNIAVPQLKEILTNYGDIAILWWDTPHGMTRERADVLQSVINISPGIITNNRLGGNYKGDTRTPEQHVPATGIDYDWESCMTMNSTWGYKSYDDNWKSTEKLILSLVKSAGKGGNYLLNVGPTSKGEIPQPSIDRLKEIGQWMSVNSESIYGTTASPFRRLTWGYCTKKVFINGATLYLHVVEWPQDGKLIVPGLQNEVKQAYLMANCQKLKTSCSAQGVTVEVPAEPLDKFDTVVVLKVAGPLNIEKEVSRQDANGDVFLSPWLADIHNRDYGRHDHARIEKHGKTQIIGNWNEPRTRIEWPFVIREKGKFIVKAEIALEAEKSSFQVIINDKPIHAEVKSTGGADKFKSVTLGQTDPLETGEHKLHIKPKEGKWHPINLRSVTLELK